MKLHAQDFSRIICRIQQGLDVLQESGAVMTFSTVLGVTALLCSFSLVQRNQVESYFIHQD